MRKFPLSCTASNLVVSQLSDRQRFQLLLLPINRSVEQKLTNILPVQNDTQPRTLSSKPVIQVCVGCVAVEKMDFDLEYIPVAEYLLSSSSALRTAEGIMAEKRVKIFKGEGAINALLADSYKRVKKAPEAGSVDEARKIMKCLLENGFILRASRMGNSKFFQPDSSRVWDDDALFVWVYEGTQLRSILIAILVLVAVFCAVMYPLWPYRLQRCVWYLVMLAMGFVGLIIAIACIRLVLFCITFVVAKPGWWLFPNLFEDCGFFESFVPFGAWHGDDVRPPSLLKKTKKQE